MPVRSLTEALPATWTRGEIAVVVVFPFVPVMAM